MFRHGGRFQIHARLVSRSISRRRSQGSVPTRSGSPVHVDRSKVGATDHAITNEIRITTPHRAHPPGSRPSSTEATRPPRFRRARGRISKSVIRGFESHFGSWKTSPPLLGGCLSFPDRPAKIRGRKQPPTPPRGGMDAATADSCWEECRTSPGWDRRREGGPGGRSTGPGGDQCTQVSTPDRVIAFEIRGTVRTWPPGCEQEAEIGSIHPPIAIEIPDQGGR